MCTARTDLCAHVKDPISICRKRLGLTACGMVTQLWIHLTSNELILGSATLSQLAFLGESGPNFHGGKSHWDNKRPPPPPPPPPPPTQPSVARPRSDIVTISESGCYLYQPTKSIAHHPPIYPSKPVHQTGPVYILITGLMKHNLLQVTVNGILYMQSCVFFLVIRVTKIYIQMVE